MLSDIEIVSMVCVLLTFACLYLLIKLSQFADDNYGLDLDCKDLTRENGLIKFELDQHKIWLSKCKTKLEAVESDLIFCKHQGE